MKVLYMDSRGGGQILLLRFEPYCEMPAHTHASSDEAAYVLEGSLKMASLQEDAPYWRKGYFAYFPAGAVHGPFSTGEEGCTIISIFYGPLK
jgi:quercetin dioxygenase-like cupin family protein